MKLRKNYDILKRISHFVYESGRNKGDQAKYWITYDIEILPQYTTATVCANLLNLLT